MPGKASQSAAPGEAAAGAEDAPLSNAAQPPSPSAWLVEAAAGAEEGACMQALVRHPPGLGSAGWQAAIRCLHGGGATMGAVAFLLLRGLSQTRVVLTDVIAHLIEAVHVRCASHVCPQYAQHCNCRSPCVDAIMLQGSMHGQPACFTAADQASRRPNSTGRSCCSLAQPRQAWGQAATVLRLEHCFSSPEL